MQLSKFRHKLTGEIVTQILLTEIQNYEEVSEILNTYYCNNCDSELLSPEATICNNCKSINPEIYIICGACEGHGQTKNILFERESGFRELSTSQVEFISCSECEGEGKEFVT